MPWTKQSSGKGARYYRRSGQVNGKPAWIYFGSGPAAELAAKEDARKLALQQADQQALLSLQRHMAKAGSIVQSLEDWLQTIEHAALLVAGYHNRNRGHWRKGRNARNHA